MKVYKIRRKLKNLQKRGEGGDEKHIFSFTWPKVPSINSRTAARTDLVDCVHGAGLVRQVKLRIKLSYTSGLSLTALILSLTV